MNYLEIMQLINIYKTRKDMKLCTKDYAKGYCYCALNLSKNITDTEYDEISKIIDDTFD